MILGTIQRRLLTGLLLIASLYQTGSCPCGCWDESLWTHWISAGDSRGCRGAVAVAGAKPAAMGVHVAESHETQGARHISGDGPVLGGPVIPVRVGHMHHCDVATPALWHRRMVVSRRTGLRDSYPLGSEAIARASAHRVHLNVSHGSGGDGYILSTRRDWKDQRASLQVYLL